MRSLILAGLLVLSATALSQSVPPRFTMQWEALAEHIAEQLDLQPGERFLAVAHPGLFDELIPHLRYQVMQAGAVDLGVIDVLAEPVPEGWNEQVLREGGLAARSSLAEMLKDVDASVMLPRALQDLMREGYGRTIHFHWLQNGSAFPLAGQPLPPVHVLEATYQRLRCARRASTALRAGDAWRRSPRHE
jgi:hypothetical protein